MSITNKIINFLHRSRALGRVFHTLDYCLQKELKDCETVLDLGCGPSSPLQYCKWIKYSVGVEIFKPYLEESKKKRIHTKYLNKKIEEVDFPEKSFDAVIMIDVLEHLPKKTGYEILKKAKKWAKKKVVVSTPNGFVKQPKIEDNPFQRHLSGWAYPEMKRLGFNCRGLAGLKFLRKEKNKNSDMKDDLTVSIKYKPKILGFMFAALTQTITYYLPSLAFELFCVKRIKK